MKKTFLYFCLLFIVQTAFAADSLYVREQQIPILIDRIDNVLYEMRIPAQKGDVLNEITIQIGDNVNLSDIQAIRLFYLLFDDDIGEKGFLFTIYMVQNHISSVFI